MAREGRNAELEGGKMERGWRKKQAVGGFILFSSSSIILSASPSSPLPLLLIPDENNIIPGLFSCYYSSRLFEAEAMAVALESFSIR